MKPFEAQDTDLLQYFDADSYALLQTIIARLIPQSEFIQIGIARSMDARLGGLKEPAGTFMAALQGLDDEAHKAFGLPFISLSSLKQDQLLHQAIDIDPAVETKPNAPMRLLFEELLSEAVAVFYSHPQDLEEGGTKGHDS